MSKIEDFLTSSEEAEIVEAIRIAEQNTSGEIRVHLEASSSPIQDKNTDDISDSDRKGDAFDRACEVFDFLHMNNTKQSNGVLIYVAVEDRTLVLMGDSGINDVVPPNFWESTKEEMISNFKHGRIKKGLVDGILKAGQQLKKHFPYKKGDENELSDQISTG